MTIVHILIQGSPWENVLRLAMLALVVEEAYQMFVKPRFTTK